MGPLHAGELHEHDTTGTGMRWLRHSEPDQQRTAEAQPLLEVDLAQERDGWAAVSLAGSFDTPGSIDALGRELLDLLLDGRQVLAVDLRHGAQLSIGALRTLVSAGVLAEQCRGFVVVTCSSARQSAVLRSLDPQRSVYVVAPLQ